MKILKFVGATSREVLNQVRAMLGEDALIISNRRNDGGQIEIMAADPDSVTNNSIAPAQAPAASSTPASVPATTSSVASSATPIAPPSPPVQAAPVRPAVAAHPAAPRVQAAGGPDVAAALAQLQDELAQRFEGLLWGGELKRSPLRTQLLRELLEAGFSITLAAELLRAAPDSLDAPALRQWLREALIARLPGPGADSATEWLSQPGVYALVGPTGVGKTTTVAKLAAQAIALHGRNQVALVTTDSYRIAAHQQLQTFGRIMGVPVHLMRSDAELQPLLQQLSGQAVVLIDNIGLSQRDRNVARQQALLSQEAGGIRRLLVLNAASQGDTLEEVVQLYTGSAPATLQGCIITKLDEASHSGTVLDIVIRHQLPLAYVCDGQQVPQDLHRPDPAALMDQALARPTGRSALYVPDDAGLAAMLEHGPARPPASPTATLAPSTAAHPAARHAMPALLPWLLPALPEAGPALSREEQAADLVAGLRQAATWPLQQDARRNWRSWAGCSAAEPPLPPLQQAQHGWQQAQAHAAGQPWLLALHGKASLAPQLRHATLAGVLLADAQGQLLAAPLPSLHSQFGHLGLAVAALANGETQPGDTNPNVEDTTLQRLDWLHEQQHQQTGATPLLHLFDHLGSTLLNALRQRDACWLAPASAALKVRQPNGRSISLKTLALTLPCTPLTLNASPPTEATPAAATTTAHWWRAHAEVELVSADAEAHGPLRLLVLRSPAAGAGAAEPAPQLLLAQVPQQLASADQLARWALQGLQQRAAFRSIAAAWQILGQGSHTLDETELWPLRALLAGQLGAAAWQAQHDPQAAALRALLRATGAGGARQASARHGVEALLRAWALGEWLDESQPTNGA